MSDEIVEARSRETFVSNVSGRSEASRFSSSSPKKARGFLKKHAPLVVIIGLLITAVSLIFLSQSFMPFALVNRFIEEFNGNGVGSILRSDSLLDVQLSSTGSYFGLSENQRTALKEAYIFPVDFTAESQGATALVYEESSGHWRAVVPKSIVSSNSLNSTISSALNNTEISLDLDPLSAEDALKNTKFKDKYATASKTWRGGNAGWYDSFEDLTEARLAIKRTRFNSWVTASFSNADEAWRNMAAGNSNAADGGLSDYGTYQDVDADGNETTTSNAGSVDSSSLSGQTTMDGVRDVLNSKITSAAKLAATVGCAGVEIMSVIQTYMAAQQARQYLNLATGYLEAVQSAQVGRNDGTPMNEYNKILTTPDPETGKTPMEATTSRALFSGTAVDPNDESIKTVSFEGLMSSLGTLTGNVNFTAQAFEACSYIKMGVAATNFVTTVLNFIPVLGQAAKAIHIVAKLVGRIALGVAVASISSFIIPKILTQVFKNVAKNVATEWVGEDYFNAMYSGAGRYLGGNFQTGGGSAASEKSLGAYNRVKEEILAEEADRERRLKSPFDMTSKNTFLGSIIYNLIPIATSSSLGSVVKNIGGVFTSSINAILPSASAIAETSLVTSLGECPIMNSVGAVCDPTGNPYYVDDLSTINMTKPELEAKILEIDPNAFSGTDSSGRKIINPKSNLGKTATIINQRIATLGIADASAANVIVQQPSGLISSLPLVGDVSQIITAIGEAENMPWISGQAGVNSESNPLWESEVKYYQAYINLDRWEESAGLTQKSSVTSLLEEFYKENPLDNSREGILARFSGLSKEEVIAVEDALDVMTYIADYKPEERLDFRKNDLAYAIMDVCQSKSCSKPKNQGLKAQETPNSAEGLMTPVTQRILLYQTLPTRTMIQTQKSAARRENAKSA